MVLSCWPNLFPGYGPAGVIRALIGTSGLRALRLEIYPIEMSQITVTAR